MNALFSQEAKDQMCDSTKPSNPRPQGQGVTIWLGKWTRVRFRVPPSILLFADEGIELGTTLFELFEDLVGEMDQCPAGTVLVTVASVDRSSGRRRRTELSSDGGRQ